MKCNILRIMRAMVLSRPARGAWVEICAVMALTLM